MVTNAIATGNHLDRAEKIPKAIDLAKFGGLPRLAREFDQ